MEFFFGGDMKIISNLLGLGSAIGNYACPWCHVHKDERGDTTKPWDHYHSAPDMIRSQHTISKFLSGKNKYGVKNKPLIKIELDHIIPVNFTS